ncbi:MAG: DUF885 domain-containing protein, partial [Parahaliea sp.]
MAFKGAAGLRVVLGGLLLLVSLSTLADESAKLAAMLDEVYERRVAQDPMLATKLGRRSGLDAWPDLSAPGQARELEQVRADLQRLHQDIRFDQLDDAARLNYRAFEADLKLRIERDRWRYHLNPINQIVGLHLEIAGLLINYHHIEDLADAESYISRLARVGQPIDQMIASLQTREARGFQLPASLFPRLIQAAESIVAGLGQDNVILADFQRKVGALDLSAGQRQGLLDRARSAFDQHFAPAYARLVAELRAEQQRAQGSDGVWKLPDGETFYQFLLRQYTTTDITADQVHALGLAEVERLHGEMDAIRRQVGFDGDLQAFFNFLKVDSRF